MNFFSLLLVVLYLLFILYNDTFEKLKTGMSRLNLQINSGFMNLESILKFR